MTLCSIVLVYLEIEFSNFKMVQEKNQFKSTNNNQIDLISMNDKTNKKFMHILVFQLQKLEHLFENFYRLNHTNLLNSINCKKLIKASESFSLRSNTLNLGVIN